MKAAGQEALDIIEARLEHLLANARTETIRAKLRNLHAACRRLVVDGRQHLTVPAVLAAYVAKNHAPDQALAESSIRNKRDGANPYHELYMAWTDASIVLLAPKRAARDRVDDGEIVSQNDLAQLKDPVVRHQMALVMAQNRSLRNQVDILKRARDVPTLQAQRGSLVGGLLLANDLALDEAEVEALRDFVEPRKMKARHLVATGDGGIVTAGGTTLADPGFLDALRKMVASYLPPRA